MYIEKHEINGETYVKLDELNDLLKSERKAIGQKMKQRHAEGGDNTGWAGAHSQLTDFARKVNMSKNGEKYIIFRRDNTGEWVYFMQLMKWNDIPKFMRRRMNMRDGEYATVSTNEIEKATLYGCYEDAQDALAEIEAECPEQVGEWHMTKCWMFDTEDNRDSLLRLFYGGGNDHKDAMLEVDHIVAGKKPGDKDFKKPYKNAKAAEQASKNNQRADMIPARYTVWWNVEDQETTENSFCFVRWEDKKPVFSNRPCMAMWFVEFECAQKVAEKLGEEWEVVDMWPVMTKEERLLRAIFCDDSDEGDDE